MGLIPKPELKNIPLNIMITPSLDEKLRASAEASGVNKSEAARFILEEFFKGESENSVQTPPAKNARDYGKIGVPS